MLLFRKYFCYCLFFEILLNNKNARSQNISLIDSIQIIPKEADGKVGVSILYPNRSELISLNGNDHFPMQSVFKFPLALKILNDA